MQKNEAYHESAIKYNEGLAKAAEELAPTIEHEEPRRWCIAVGKQHRFHAKRHKSALEKLRNKQEAPAVERILDGLDVPEPNEEAEDVVEEKTDEDLKIVHEPVESSSVQAEGVVSGSNANVASMKNGDTAEVFPDGCVGEHRPMEPSCEYYPKEAEA